MAADFGFIRLLNPVDAPRFVPGPSAVGIEITKRCQLRCHHCFNDSGPEHGQELPLPLIERTLDEMGIWGANQIRLSGGEPTLHSQLGEILDACAIRGIAITLNSHGVLSDATLARLLASPVARFIISLDGLEAAHERVRGEGTFHRAVATCRRLCAAGKAVTIACHLGRHNTRDVAGLAALAAELGADLKLTPLRPVGRILAKDAAILPDAKDYLGVIRQVSRLRLAHPHIRILADFDILDARNEPFAVTDALAACGAGRIMVSIAATGQVYPCAFFVTPDHRFSAGNLHRRSLREIWRDSPVFEPFRVHTKAPACQACGHYRRRCAGGCPAIACFRLGDLDALDPTCFAHLLEPSR